ncbi:hypothetical protein V5799_018062 [Amblyomma americanum]|uniref:Uncharacterized protein n=1 Tax=Amblyomma americanum TaxID=6943 RepID=A0AAQ4F0H2_AMBAM
MGRRGQTKETTEEDSAIKEWVQCTTCKSWLVLEDTPYDTVHEAREDPAFKCHQCIWMNVLRDELTTYATKEKENWKLEIANIKARLDDELTAIEVERSGLKAELEAERKGLLWKNK